MGNFTLHYEGLESTFHKLSDSKTEDIIEFSFRFLKKTETDHTADEGLT